jgi:nucleoid-associated protein YgaU
MRSMIKPHLKSNGFVLAATLAVLLATGPACGPTEDPVQATTAPTDTAVKELPPPTPTPREEYADPGPAAGRTHLVEAGDTLYSLAEKYYGSQKQWRKIFVANRNRLTDPNHLAVGMKLIIP